MRRTALQEVPPQLAEHLVFAGSDLDAANDAVSRVFGPHTVRLLNRGDPIAAYQYAARIGDLTLSHVGYGAPVEIVATEHADRFFCIQLPTGGRAEVSSGAQRIVSTPRIASVPTPSEVLRMRWEAPAAHRIIKIDHAALERYLGQLLGRPPDAPVRLMLGLDIGTLHGARWQAIHELLLAELVRGSEPAGTASAAAVQDVVMSSLLLGHPNNYWEQLRGATSSAKRVYVHRAIEYAKENLDQPLTIGELAEVAGVGVRALQAGFRDNVGCSPIAWIRNRRLEKAHAELGAAEPGDGTRVTDVALRCGFSHFGRFSQLYRERFGARPSETLRG